MLCRRLHEYIRFLKSLYKTVKRLIVGMWRLTKMPQPAITIFGGARVTLDSPYALKATEIAKILAGDGFTIITGGGPGIMEAANLGAMQYLRECNINGDCRTKRVSAGVGLVRLNKERVNPYVQENIIMEHFFARKWLLVRYSVGFIVFPGGFGTMDELFEIITLMQCNRMAHMPVVLMGTNYWEPLMTWIHSRALAEKFINAEDTEMFTVTDDINVAVEKIRSGCIDCTESVSYNGMVKK